LGPEPKRERPEENAGPSEVADGVRTAPLRIEAEKGLPLAGVWRCRADVKRKDVPVCVLLHLEGRAAARKHPLATALIEARRTVVAADLRATGEARPPDGIRDAVDHNAAEHAIWIGRPLLGQWLVDVRALVDLLTLQPGDYVDHVAVVGIG